MSRVVAFLRQGFLVAALSLVAVTPAVAADAAGSFTLRQILGYPFPTELTGAASSHMIAWQLNERGVRNIWVASGPDFTPRQITHNSEDNGQELTALQLSPDGKYAVYVRGGDHHNIYASKAPPDPLGTIAMEKVQLWSVPTDGGKPIMLANGDSPAISPDSKHVVFINDADNAVWIAALDGSGKPHRLFYDNGNEYDLQWSPDGKQLAFVSARGDHSFIGIYTQGDDRIRYMAPTTNRDFSPRWSLDGKRIAFVRRPGSGGKPKPLLKRTPRPWAIWVADVATGQGTLVWQSPHTLLGSMPDTDGRANLHWAAGDRLVFLSNVDGWPHLYSIAASGGGEPLRLTAGDFMVENVTMTPDRRSIVYSANTGDAKHDIDRRHLFKVSVSGGSSQALTPGTKLQWSPVVVHGGDTLAFIRAGAKTPPLVAVKPLGGGAVKLLDRDRIADDFPTDALVVPKRVTFKADDGMVSYGQLFVADGGPAHKPAVIFVHGGPMRQMLLGWHYSGYYSNAYAINQYLANHGYVVLSVDYRLGIGHGWHFHHPEHAGPAGGSEYKDVLAGARFLQQLAYVDDSRIGIWGGSYGGYLTALALARDSDIFKVGVDWAGVHDWALGRFHDWGGYHRPVFERGDKPELLKAAWKASPVAAMDTWRSPVLLIQGDNDHNVRFHQTVDLANRLRAHKVPFEELIFPNETHSFLLYSSWYRANQATVQFLDRHLKDTQ